MVLTTLTRVELLDILADSKAEFQHARRIGNEKAMQLAGGDINSIYIELSSMDNCSIEKVKLETN